jgi:hypothetical protein
LPGGIGYYKEISERVVWGGGWVAEANGKYVCESTEFRPCTIYFYSPSSTLLYAPELLLLAAAYQKCHGDGETVTLLLRDVPVSFFLESFAQFFSCNILRLPIPTFLSNSLLVIHKRCTPI